MTKIEQIKEITKSLVGNKCVQATRTHGTMFILDFGKQYPAKSPSKSPSFDWSLTVENCRYTISNNDKELAHQNSEENTVQQTISNLQSLKVINLEVSENDSHTTFTFENGYQLVIDSFPGSNAWSLRDQKGYYLCVGPDNFWEYISGDTQPKY